MSEALLARTFRSLRHRDYALYFAGQVVSFTGSWMQSAALMWLSFALTDDPFWPPVMLVAAVGPTLILGPLGGALADKYPKKRLVFATQACFAVSAAFMAMAVLLNLANPWLLFSLQLANGLVQAIDLPARLAFVPDLIPKDDLINAVGLNSLTFNVARAVGPALAGLAYLAADTLVPADPVKAGAAACFTLNALSYIAVLYALSRISVGGRRTHIPHRGGRFLDGFRFLLGHPGLAGLIVLTGLFSIFGWPLLTLLPAYTKSVLGGQEKAYSFLVSALGAGALVGSLVTASFGTPARRERFLLIGALAGCAGLAGVAMAQSLAPAFASCGLFGFGLILYLSTGQSTMQLGSPDTARGKVMALWAMTLSGSSIPGHLIAGQAARVYPIPDVLLAMLVGVSVTVLGVLALVLSGRLHPDHG